MLEIPTMILLGVQHNLLENLKDKVIMAGIIGCHMNGQISFCLTYLINCLSMLT